MQKGSKEAQLNCVQSPLLCVYPFLQAVHATELVHIRQLLGQARQLEVSEER
jgi:hypothetical protein